MPLPASVVIISEDASIRQLWQKWRLAECRFIAKCIQNSSEQQPFEM